MGVYSRTASGGAMVLLMLLGLGVAITSCATADTRSAVTAAGRRTGSKTPVKATTDTTYRWGGFDTPDGGDTNEADSPTAVGNLSDITAIAAGNASDMALDSSGHVWTWGDGVNGVLGDGSTDDHVSTAVEVTGLPTIVAIAEADDTDVAIDASGNVWGWGWNESGQLCLGDTKEHKSPVELTKLSGVVAAAGGGMHMTYLLADGTMEACGRSGSGELGNGTTTNSEIPVKVVGLPSSPIKAITAGPSTSTALLENGEVWDWGNNKYGQLGDGTQTASDVPVQVDLPAGSTAEEVYEGGDDRRNGQSLALLTNGQVWGWGNDLDGQLGNGRSRRVISRPVEATALPSGVTFTFVASGGAHSLGLDSNGNVWAWGSNTKGQVGEGSAGGSVLAPVNVLSGATIISATANDSVASAGSG
jgi:alpha-tubulin suppressor-like RCC1 family protein